ncbi:uncharacterized protein LOC100168759 isoform X2 [Acyrthosiphon pisum]|uniref:Hsr-9 Tudor domain-containing protein n=1 Tax=Acyrthosiphon pisum TaxID=7029 RepID=A0A8R2A9K1_ACYPI|nr:uncharacterized protein LOC100168759 isoform X2 [Acyrthosiphon pisum]|eukprot:XP_003246625.1 PREDICTED: uncharacterized protein LOC100168759 isoform X2 [Acyrthosiphon pisum]
MDDKIELKTEHSLPAKTEPTDDEMALSLASDETLCLANNGIALNCDQLSVNSVSEFNNINHSDIQQPAKDNIVTSSQYLTAQTAGSWDSHIITPPTLFQTSSEIVLHGPLKEVHGSTSESTAIDSDREIQLFTEDKEKSVDNLYPEYDYIFCIAAISRTTPNSSKLLAISKIDSNIKVDVKSDVSSLNGYAADHSSSSNSTCGHLMEEPFLVPKAPRDSFMSSSASFSGSSTGTLLQPSKSKHNNILLSKNVYTYPENLACHKCDHVYPRVTENYMGSSMDIKSEPETKPRTGKSRQKKRPKQNNDSSSKKILKKTKQNSENVFNEKNDIKIEEPKCYDMPIDSVEYPTNEENPTNNEIPTNDNIPSNDPITFKTGDKVFAYWMADKMFYPAIIIDIDAPKFKVEFLSDYYIKLLNSDCLVHSSALKKGTLVAIFDTVSQEYRVGEIITINEVPNGEKTYTVDLNSEEVVVPFEKLVLDTDKARNLQDKIVLKNYHRLSMSNVSEGKRLRLSRSTSTKCKTTKNESSKRKKTKQDAPETNKKKRKCLFPEVPDPRYIPSTSTGITAGDDYDEGIFQATSSDSDFDHVREDLTNVNLSQLKNSDIDSEHSSPDKICSKVVSPSAKSIKIFENLHFIVSYSKYKRMPMANESDGTDSEINQRSRYFQPDKIHKKYLESLIYKHGGACHRYLNVLPKSCYKNSYIITDTPSQTCNFLLGLSLGIPAYHHRCIEHAISQKLPFPEFLIKNDIKPIPNGWSMDKKEMIFRSPETIHSNIFSDYVVYIALSDESKNSFFSSLLKFSGAIVYTITKRGAVSLPLIRHMTVIVTDDQCPSSIMNHKIPKLSVIWLVQSLLCESPRPIDAHESYIAISDECE